MNKGNTKAYNENEEIYFAFDIDKRMLTSDESMALERVYRGWRIPDEAEKQVAVEGIRARVNARYALGMTKHTMYMYRFLSGGAATVEEIMNYYKMPEREVEEHLAYLEADGLVTVTQEACGNCPRFWGTVSGW